MPLPPADALLSLPADAWRGLAARLRAVGLTPERVSRVNATAPGGIDAMRMTVLRWHLRRERDVAAHAMRAFLYRDALDEAEARAMLGDALGLERALEIGLLAREADGRVRSPYFLALINQLFILYDDLRNGSDAVMGLGHTTSDLCRASFPTRRVGRVLDLGCGAGTAALLCASRADEVIGVDVSPRAVALAEVNARLNAVENVEFRQGDLFAPVAGESFDLVVSQPPFIALPAGEGAATTLHGGARGDELALRLLRELPPHLGPGGRAVLLVEWPIVDGDPLEPRLRGALPGEDLSLLLLQAKSPSLDEHCAGYAVTETQSLGAELEARFAVLRDHLDRMKIRALALTLTVVQRAPRAPGWTSTLDIRALPEVDLRSERIDEMIAARDLLSEGIDALLAATLRIPKEARFTEERPDEGGPGRIAVDLPPQALVARAYVGKGVVSLVGEVNAADSVRDALQRMAEAHGAPYQAVVDEALPALQNALLYGLLEIAE